MRVLSLVLVLTVWASTAEALTWRELEGEMNRTAAGGRPDPAVLQRLGDITQTLVTYSRAHKAQDEKSLLFCPPTDRPFHLDELVSLIKEQAVLTGQKGEVLVQELLLDGLRRRFPCRHLK